jgi:aromatic-L-amino-acid decarboxylase
VSDHPLEPGGESMRAMGGAAVELLARFVESLPDRPASNYDGIAELVEEMQAAPPEDGVAFEELLDRFRRAADRGLEHAGPGFMAYVPGGGLYASAVADFLACGFNRFLGIGSPAPALVAIEQSVLQWLCDLYGLPDGAQGLLTSGGSLAQLSAIAAARTARLGEHDTGARLYVSAHTHHSVAKAARLAGFRPSALVTIPVDGELRMDVTALAAAVAADRAAGLRPFLVVGTAGSTDTGTVDPLPRLAELAHANGLWFHVDAAYGGPFVLTERGRSRLSGIEAADSITVDPHKGFFVPHGTGALLVRSREDLLRAHSGDEPHYLQDLVSAEAVPSFADLSPELTRDFRGLRVWLPLHLHGVAAFRDALDEKLDLARRAYEQLREIPELELPFEPDLSIVSFRHRARDTADPDGASRRLLELVNDSRRVFLSSTSVGGRMLLRICVLIHRTHQDRVDECVELIRQGVRRLASE